MASIKKFLGNKKGFSLIELMIVVGIIGILATLAVPRFQSFQARAKQSEAMTLLNQIYTLQEVYQMDNNGAYSTWSSAYGDNNSCGTAQPAGASAIGFSIPNCSENYYRYTVTTHSTGFLATATTGTGTNNKIAPGCGTADVQTMNGEHIHEHLDAKNAAIQC